MRDLGSTQPTAAELEILRIVWAIEPCTVGDVHARLVAEKGTNYSTTMKMLSLMLGKGLLVRDERASPHRYRARLTRNKARRSMLGELIDKVYEGSAMAWPCRRSPTAGRRRKRSPRPGPCSTGSSGATTDPPDSHMPRPLFSRRSRP